MKTYKDLGLPSFRCKNYSHTQRPNYMFSACVDSKTLVHSVYTNTNLV